jgi:poly-gamma-glutamate synthesis protein (capsule biosynthesis protein)
MKKFLAYFFSGLTCLGVGAGVYIVASVFYHSSAPSLPFATRMTMTDAANELLPLVGKMFVAKTGVSVISSVSTPTPIIKPTTVFFGGDIMLGREVAQVIAKNGSDYPFVNIKNTVSGANYAIANLEGPITTINNAPNNSMRFHFDPAMTTVLSVTGFDAFSLANNHGLDQGEQGFIDTKNNLTAVHLGYFGDASDDNGPILHFTVNGKNFAAIGAQDVYRKIDPVAIAKEIVLEKAAGNFVIIYPHWGVEYSHAATKRQTTLAHAFIDAGADIVVGSHPHVIEGIEIYKGKPIFYSLGNLVFDQYFFADTQEGLGLRLNIDASGDTSIDLLPYKIPQSQPTIVAGEQRTKLLQALASYSSPALKDQIISGSIKLVE